MSIQLLGSAAPAAGRADQVRPGGSGLSAPARRRSAVSLHFLPGPGVQCRRGHGVPVLPGTGVRRLPRDAHCAGAGQRHRQHRPASGSFSPGPPPQTLCEHAHARFLTAINGTQNALSTEAVDEAVTPDAGGQAGVLPRTGRQYAPGKRHLRPLRQPFHQVPHRRRQPFAAADCQPDERGRRCALRFLLRCDPRHDGDPAHGQGRRGKNHPTDPLRGLPRRIARQMSSFSAAHRKARWTPAASPSRWRCSTSARYCCCAT